jgi:hypothetical protein
MESLFLAVYLFAQTITTFRVAITSENNIEILGEVSSTGEVRVSPLIRSICEVDRFRRNLIAASKGSRKANRYLEKCVEAYISKKGRTQKPI